MEIDDIADNEHFECSGDVHVRGSIGRNATVIVKDGNLIIDGFVADDSSITMLQEQNQSVNMISSGCFFSVQNITSIGAINIGKSLLVKKHVGNRVTFKSHNAEFVVEGDVGEQCSFKTHNGEIRAGNVGSGTSLVSHNGDISVHNVCANASLVSHNGSVLAGHLGEGVKVSSHNGDVRVNGASKSAKLSSYNGTVYEAGIARKKEKAKHGGMIINIGGITMSGVSGGQIIVNGRDITDLVNAQKNQGDKGKVEAPVRYFKK